MRREITTANGAEGRTQPDFVRPGVPLVALAFAVVAAVTDPAGWASLAALAAGVAMFVLWARVAGLPTLVLTAGVLVAVTLAQLSGALEPAMFLVSLLAVVVAGWELSPWLLGVACLLATATPVMIAALQPPGNHLAWGIWMIGVAFSAVIGRGVYRQRQLSAELESARRELALQARAEERRRMARDIHDVVGHGLAAVLLQVTGARHVLGRDPAAADEALAAAEDVGRRSMQELRGAVALLRSADDSAVAPPAPGSGELRELVAAARERGLTVEYRCSGDVRVDPALALVLHRITQEALLNAARHAPDAATFVSVEVDAGSVALEVESVGPLAAPAHTNRPHYGLVGMQERATSVGGALQAGPTPEGWRVRCRLPAAFA